MKKKMLECRPHCLENPVSDAPTGFIDRATDRLQDCYGSLVYVAGTACSHSPCCAEL